MEFYSDIPPPIKPPRNLQILHSNVNSQKLCEDNPKKEEPVTCMKTESHTFVNLHPLHLNSASFTPYMVHMHEQCMQHCTYDLRNVTYNYQSYPIFGGPMDVDHLKMILLCSLHGCFVRRLILASRKRKVFITTEYQQPTNHRSTSVERLFMGSAKQLPQRKKSITTILIQESLKWQVQQKVIIPLIKVQ